MTYTLEQLKALDVTATHGPWKVDYNDGDPTSYVVLENEDGHDEALIECFVGPHDVEFIVAARIAIPELIAEVESKEVMIKAQSALNSTVLDKIESCYQEIERLRALITEAPHDPDCAYIDSIWTGLNNPPRCPVADCNCWKDKLLKRQIYETSL